MNSNNHIGRSRLGIFGGTFDPPHVGHLILADEALHQLNLTRILWVLTPFPPHKTSQAISPIEHRFAMLQAAIDQYPYFEINLIDMNRPAPHFAVDTVRLLRLEYPQSELVYLMGGDSLDDLLNWHDAAGFVATCDAIGVMRRPGEFIDLIKLETAIQGVSDKVEFLNAPFVEISSSLIRKRVSQGGAFRFYLTDLVYETIQRLGLYKG